MTFDECNLQEMAGIRSHVSRPELIDVHCVLPKRRAKGKKKIMLRKSPKLSPRLSPRGRSLKRGFPASPGAQKLTASMLLEELNLPSAFVKQAKRLEQEQLAQRKAPRQHSSRLAKAQAAMRATKNIHRASARGQ